MEAWVEPSLLVIERTVLMPATVRCSSSRGILLSDGSLDPAIGRATAQ